MATQELLIICSGEYSFGQMMAGYVKFYSGNNLRPTVVAIEKDVLHPLAVQVMKEDGIDISSARNMQAQHIGSKTYDLLINLLDDESALTATVNAREAFNFSILFDESLSAFTDVIEQFRNKREQIRVFAIETAGKYSATCL